MWPKFGAKTPLLCVAGLLLFVSTLSERRPSERTRILADVRDSAQTETGRDDPANSGRRNNNRGRIQRRTTPVERRDADANPDNSQAWGDRAKNYLINARGIGADRIVTIDGGCRKLFTVELWVAPVGAKLPTATPTKPCRRQARSGDDPGSHRFFTPAGYLSADTAANVFGGQTRAARCPTISVSCPSELVSAGTTVTFTVNVSGGLASVTPRYNWMVSAGLIRRGQGTDSITVDTRGLPNLSTVTATADVGGYDTSCSTSASCTTGISEARLARKIDSYGRVHFGDEQARLDNFAIELQNEPTALGFIVVYDQIR